jgi:hypothetical protein
VANFQIHKDSLNYQILTSFEETWDAALNYKSHHPEEHILPSDHPPKFIGFSTSNSDASWQCPIESFAKFIQPMIKQVGSVPMSEFRLSMTIAINQGIKFEDFDFENWHLLCDVHLT